MFVKIFIASIFAYGIIRAFIFPPKMPENHIASDMVIYEGEEKKVDVYKLSDEEWEEDLRKYYNVTKE